MRADTDQTLIEDLGEPDVAERLIAFAQRNARAALHAQNRISDLEDTLAWIKTELGEITDASGHWVMGEAEVDATDWQEWPKQLNQVDRTVLARVWEILLEAD